VALTEIQRVRNLTSPDTVKLPDWMIGDYLADHAGTTEVPVSSQKRVLLASADCCDYLLTFTDWDSYTAEGVTVTRNLLAARAESYRVRAARLVEAGTEEAPGGGGWWLR
jgi:hypothetical protein